MDHKSEGTSLLELSGVDKGEIHTHPHLTAALLGGPTVKETQGKIRRPMLFLFTSLKAMRYTLSTPLNLAFLSRTLVSMFLCLPRN